MPLPPGTSNLSGQLIANGRLKFLELLGSGSFGAVYKALDVQSDPSNPDYYAIKCLPQYPEGTRKSDRQLRELLIQRRCAHPNIVAIHRVYFESPHVFVVLDFCDGGDLFRFMNNGSCRLRKNDILIKKLFVDILDAVEHCHQLGFAHRDLKPENIFLAQDLSKVWLGDFGLACSAKISTNYGCGSKPYMSPECFNRGAFPTNGYCVLRSDIWSLGVILVNLISGHQPWLIPSTQEDKFFRLYVCNPSLFLRRGLRISTAAVQILAGTFQLDPHLRPSISLLREQVLRIDTFFLRSGETTLDPFSTNSKTRIRTPRKLMKGVLKSLAPSKPSNSNGLLSSSMSNRRWALYL